MLNMFKSFVAELRRIGKHVKYVLYVLLVIRIFVAIYVRLHDQND